MTPADAAAGDAGLLAPVIEDRAFYLHDLFLAGLRAGQPVIRDRIFRRCTLQGPAVLLCLNQVNFLGCDMGQAGDDIRNLLLRPMAASRVIGVIPLTDCTLESCRLVAVGYTGSDSFLDSFIASVGESAAAKSGASQ